MLASTISKACSGKSAFGFSEDSLSLVFGISLACSGDLASGEGCLALTDLAPGASHFGRYTYSGRM